MESKDLKKIFGEFAKQSNFDFLHGGWFKESKECIVVLNLQKSNYGNYFDLNIKTYIQGVFGLHYSKSKKLLNDTGDVFTRQPKEYSDALNLTNQISDEARKIKIEELFSKFVIPETNTCLSRAGIIELAKKGEYILPAIKKELGI